MNSYNENLQNTVSATLQNQNLNLKGLKSQYKASMYSLYYAEDATITAEEKLNAADTDLGDKAKVKEQAVRNMSISANQLNSSTQANQYNGQSVTNMATCASNVQIASTAITRLAADVGSIFSIVNAADYGSDIYTLTDQVKGLVNTTAYNAELTSQTAMEASAATSEVSASTVLNDAKATNALMTNVLQIASADYNTASQTVAADNSTLATVNTNEKLAEGAFEDADIDFFAGMAAYESVNLGLNLGLTALPLTSESFLVFFDRIKAPFPPPLPPAITPINPPVVVQGEEWYPVSHYYIFVVKESKQLTFSISEAENLRINGKDRYVKIGYEVNEPTSEIVLQHSGMIGKVIEYKNVQSSGREPHALQDTDGQPIVPGNNYVVFVMAVYLDPYKRLINNFNDFLSAPSLSFCMTTLLDPAKNVFQIPTEFLKDDSKADKKVKEELKKLKDAKVPVDTIAADAIAEDAKHVLFFEAKPPADAKAKMGCECMYLPVTIKVPEPFMTRSAFDLFIRQQIKSDKIKLQNILKLIEASISDLKERKKAKQTGADEAAADVHTEPKETSDYITLLEAKLKELRVNDTNTQTKFFFNKDLAEIVPSGSSTSATQILIKADGKDESLEWWYALIGPATTDNFGNLLSSAISYAPAVLTLSTSDDEAVVNAYTSNISDYETVDTFSY